MHSGGVNIQFVALFKTAICISGRKDITKEPLHPWTGRQFRLSRISTVWKSARDLLIHFLFNQDLLPYEHQDREKGGVYSADLTG
jgi:hypothetical protein